MDNLKQEVHMPKKETKSVAIPARLFFRAKKIADRYHYVLEKTKKDGWIASSLELPQVYGSDKTGQGCFAKVVSSTIAAVATLLEMKQTPPAPQAKWRSSISGK